MTEPKPELMEHLAVQDPDTQIEAKEAFLDISGSRGWEAFQTAAALRVAQLKKQLIDRPSPRENVADYERLIGEIRGLESIEQITDGLIRVGEDAEAEQRETNTHA